MSPLVTAEIVAGVLVLLAVSTLAFIFVRRRLLVVGRAAHARGVSGRTAATATGSACCASPAPASSGSP